DKSLIQTIGRAARNVNAKVILYADKVTEAMRSAMEETSRRRAMQEKYNAEHGITPETIKKNIRAGIEEAVSAHRQANAAVGRNDDSVYITEEYVGELEEEMYEAARQLDFEKAAALRDRIGQMRESMGQKLSEVQIKSYKPGPKTRKRKGGSHIPRPKKKA
ncbi:MAG TPA: UvrB/UvrC motif-containing protein, partial [Pirellulaceae bacterium]|nr:UvrB/UvrC motif-containing protein [Pirellulaceae bacterium]